jgi:hypothetical protein
MDFTLLEGAAGDEVVEVAGGFPQLAVALAHRGGGDPGQLLGKGRSHIALTCAVSDCWELDGTCWPLELAGLELLEQHRGHLAGWDVQIAAGGPPVRTAGGVTAGWGDHIAAPAAPVHVLEVSGVNVAEAGRGQVEVPAASAGAHQRS